MNHLVSWRPETMTMTPFLMNEMPLESPGLAGSGVCTQVQHFYQRGLFVCLENTLPTKKILNPAHCLAAFLCLCIILRHPEAIAIGTLLLINLGDQVMYLIYYLITAKPKMGDFQ